MIFRTVRFPFKKELFPTVGTYKNSIGLPGRGGGKRFISSEASHKIPEPCLLFRRKRKFFQALR
jgi:hypothetical protein